MLVGPTAAAMVVSSSKGAILPTTMAQLFVDNGYRTVSNGTAWSAFSFVADYFDFDEYYTTSNFNTALNYLETDNDNDGNFDYYVVVSCGSGLFTTGGHYIVLVAENSDTLTVYDPYLYNGKFDTASRRGAGVVVSGNSAYVTESAFRQYANYRNFWIFSNDEGEGNSNTSNSTTNTSVNYTRYVSTQSLNLNVRSGAGTNYSVIGKLSKGTAVTVTQVSSSWSYITSPVTGWVSNSYLSSTAVTTNSNTSYSTTVGNYYRLKNRTYLYSNSNLTGTRYTYLAQTQIRVISHVNANVDYIYVVKTGRYAYCSTSAFANPTSSNSVQNSTVGNYYRLANRTYLYANSNMSGTRYTYLAQTQVKVLQNVSSSVDYVQVVKTGRKAYVYKSTYK